METRFLLNSFKEAWEMLLNLPYPFTPQDDIGEETDDNDLLLLNFPVIGAVIGAAALFSAYLITLLFPGRLVSAIFSAVVITLGTELIINNSNLSMLLIYLTGKISRLSDYELSLRLGTQLSLSAPLSAMSFFSLYLIKLSTVALLVYYGNAAWLIIVYTLAFLIRSQIAQVVEFDSDIPVIEADTENGSVRNPWIAAGIISLLAGLSCSLPAAVLSLPAAFALSALFRKYAVKNGGISAELVGVYGSASELILLLLGASILIRI